MRKIRARIVLCGLTLLWVGAAEPAAAQLRLSPDERIAEIIKEHPCHDYPFKIVLFQQDETFRPAACALVGLAFSQIAAGQGKRLGLVAADTANVDRVFAGNEHIKCFTASGARDSTCDDAFWNVDMRLSGHVGSVRMTLDERTGRIEFSRSEPLPPFGVKPPWSALELLSEVMASSLEPESVGCVLRLPGGT